MARVERFSATVQCRDDAGPAILGALEAAEGFAVRTKLPPIAAARLSVVVEELVSNALHHGAGERAAAIELALTAADGVVTLELADTCAAFDPTAERPFDGPDSESGGGVGLALIRAWARDWSYSREKGRNCIRLALPLEG